MTTLREAFEGVLGGGQELQFLTDVLKVRKQQVRGRTLHLGC